MNVRACGYSLPSAALYLSRLSYSGSLHHVSPSSSSALGGLHPAWPDHHAELYLDSNLRLYPTECGLDFICRQSSLRSLHADRGKRLLLESSTFSFLVPTTVDSTLSIRLVGPKLVRERLARFQSSYAQPSRFLAPSHSSRSSRQASFRVVQLCNCLYANTYRDLTAWWLLSYFIRCFATGYISQSLKLQVSSAVKNASEDPEQFVA